MEEIAAEIGLSIAQFKKVFKARFGPFLSGLQGI